MKPNSQKLKVTLKLKFNSIKLINLQLIKIKQLKIKQELKLSKSESDIQTNI